MIPCILPRRYFGSVRLTDAWSSWRMLRLCRRIELPWLVLFLLRVANDMHENTKAEDSVKVELWRWTRPGQLQPFLHDDLCAISIVRSQGTVHKRTLWIHHWLWRYVIFSFPLWSPCRERKNTFEKGTANITGPYHRRSGDQSSYKCLVLNNRHWVILCITQRSDLSDSSSKR